VSGLAGGAARVDLLLSIACVGLVAAALWRLLTHGFVARDTPLYLIAFLIPAYWGTVALARFRLKRRKGDSDHGST
jgi:hypothetical protein